MSTVVKSRQNDTVDLIVYRHYGAEAGAAAVEAVLEANRHLGAQGVILPIGLDIVLPDLTPPRGRGLSLWGAP